MGKCPPGCLFWCAYVIVQAPRAGPNPTHREHAEGLIECSARECRVLELIDLVATMLYSKLKVWIACKACIVMPTLGDASASAELHIESRRKGLQSALW